MNSRFRELWDESYKVLNIETIRLNMEFSRIDKQVITDYYQDRIVNGLWFSKTFASEFNSWLWEHVEDRKKRNDIRTIMTSFDPPANSLKTAWGGICIGIIGLIIGIVFLCSLQVVIGVIACLVGITLFVGACFLLHRNKGKTNLDAIKMELNRIGDTIENMI